MTGRIRLRAVRRIDADPASTALLLAGPSATELWPAASRTDDLGARAAGGGTDASAGGPLLAAEVTVEPPRRTPTAFVTRFSWTGPAPVATGVLTLTYAPGRHGTPSTRAELVLDVEGSARTQPDEDRLRALVEGFLANLARAVQDRRAA